MNRITKDQIVELLAQDKAGRITREDFQKFLRNPKRIIRGSQTEYPVIIDYSQSLKQMIAAAMLDSVHSDINDKNFPIMKEGIVETTFMLERFDHPVRTTDAVGLLDKKGFRPATIVDLIAFGTIYPDVQEEFGVVAVGTLWDPGNVHHSYDVPYLSHSNHGRSLSLFRSAPRWKERYRFLVVRK